MSQGSRSSSAASVAVNQANHFTLSGGGIHVDFFAADLIGRPQLNYHDASRTESFSGDSVRIVDVPDLGTVVSVTLKLLVDVSSTTFSLLLPRTTVLPGASASVSTDGITTLHKTPFALPQANLGQHDIYTVTRLRGTASFVQT